MFLGGGGDGAAMLMDDLSTWHQREVLRRRLLCSVRSGLRGHTCRYLGDGAVTLSCMLLSAARRKYLEHRRTSGAAQSRRRTLNVVSGLTLLCTEAKNSIHLSQPQPH